MHNVGGALYNSGELREACALEKDVVDRLQGSASPIDSSPILMLRGLCLLRTGHPARALVWLDKGLRMSLNQNDFVNQLNALKYRAQGLIALGRLSAADADLEHAAALLRSHRLSDIGPQIIQAQLLLARRRPEAAWKLVEPALAITRDPRRGEKRYLGRALLLATRVAGARGKHQDAVALASEALHEEERRALDPDLSADVGEAALLVAQCRHALQDEPGMRSAAQQAVTSLTASLGADHPLTKQALGMLRQEAQPQ